MVVEGPTFPRGETVERKKQLESTAAQVHPGGWTCPPRRPDHPPGRIWLPARPKWPDPAARGSEKQQSFSPGSGTGPTEGRASGGHRVPHQMPATARPEGPLPVILLLFRGPHQAVVQGPGHPRRVWGSRTASTGLLSSLPRSSPTCEAGRWEKRSEAFGLACSSFSLVLSPAKSDP